MSTYVRSFDTPMGRLSVVARGGAIVAVHLPGDAPTRSYATSDPPAPDEAILRDASRQLTEYFAGRRTTFDLPLGSEGTAFQRDVWSALGRIPFGETRSYADVARQIGRPSAVRAVGAANGRNPIAIVVPCHRVVGKGGDLVGYGGGLPAKRWLLDHEARVTPRASSGPR